MRRRRSSAIGAALAGALAYAWWRPFRVEIEGGSMSPALEPQEWAIAVRAHPPGAGHVVVVEHPERPGFELVKRVVSVEGGELWIEGDAAAASTDSRTFGPVSVTAVRGRVVAVYHPWRRARLVR